jgi:predicted nucleic acid-binding protein
MILVDTSVWVEFFRQKGALVSIFEEKLVARELCAPSFVFGELLQGAKDARERSILHKVWASLPRLEEEGVWIRAGEFASKHKTFAKGVGLLDVAILMTARHHQTRLWTLDKKLRGLMNASEQFNAPLS